MPLAKKQLDGFDGRRDGTNHFIYSRYLVPFFEGFQGHAVFVDGDMIVTEDIYKILDGVNPNHAVSVVQHDYKTKHPKKYVGTKLQSDNIDYPRKNWSSVMVWNCRHPSNALLTKDFVAQSTGAFLHRFEWLNDDEIGALDPRWNWLVGEYEHRPASLYHYTVGAPGFDHYSRCDAADFWHDAKHNAMRMG
ncbi:MAG: glycosyltransferase [Cyanobacteria bacterium P01_G01_bin.4]